MKIATVLLLALASSMAAKGGVRGFVLTPDGLPLGGVRVLRGGATVAHTDSEGMFVIDVPVGEHRFIIEATGYERYETPLVRVEPGEDTEVIILLAGGGGATDVEAPAAGLDPPVNEVTKLGVVTGRVRDRDGEPIDGARIFARGTGAEAQSTPAGSFDVDLPVGRWTLTIIHPGFATKNQAVEVLESGVRVEVVLDKKAIDVAEMIVSKPKIEGSSLYVLEERRASSNVEDVVGADQISKAGDSDAASALERVTGVTVVGGRFVYVRGLGERYSATLLNGATLPSPDPERRVVPLDLFPAGVISSITVQKTYSPDLPGEFGGGTVVLRTKDIPDAFTAKVGVSTGYLTSTTFAMSETYDGGSTDILGFGAGARALPDDLAAASAEARIEGGDRFSEGFSATELEAFGEALDNNFGTKEQRLTPPLGLSAEVGGKFSLFGYKTGSSVAVSWGSDRFYRRSVLRTHSTSAQLNDFQNDELSTEVRLAAIGTMGVDFSDASSLRATVSVNRISEDSTLRVRGFFDEQGTDIDLTRLRWVEQMLISSQLRGTNVLDESSDLALDWSYMYSRANRDEPNRREIRYDFDAAAQQYFFSLRTSGNRRFFSELADDNHDLTAAVSLPVKLFSNVKSTLEAGLGGTFKDRSVRTRRYRFDLGGDAIDRERVRSLPPDQIFSTETISPDLFRFEEVTLADDNYDAEQQVAGGFLMGDFGLLENLTVQAGARIEWSRQALDTRDPVAAAGEEDVHSELKTVDVLPAVTATWELIEDMQLRAAFSRTVNRPNFRELSPARFFDVRTGAEFRGNPDLDRATITHGDLRWEWYPGPGESVSAAVFVKTFERPIENTIKGGASLVYTPANVDATAVNIGGEIEVRKNFGFIGSAFEDLYVAGNLTLVTSTIDLSSLDTLATSTTRPLQGQSPYAINLQVAYDSLETETSLAVLFNVFGRRIDSVGSLGVPDVYEEPVPTLDFVAQQRIGRFKVGAKVKNILNPEVRLTQTLEGDDKRNFETYRKGLLVSLGVSMDLE